MTFYHLSIEEVIEKLACDPKVGLSETEAQKRLEQYGENRLHEKKKHSILRRFADQFKDVMILILIAAATVSFGIAVMERNPREFFEPILILVIVILNAILGVLQESKAEKALDALKNLSAPHARILRDGKEMLIESACLVPGDLIRLQAGDFVPADARLIQSSSLKAEEATLTGESLPSEKDALSQSPVDAPLGDRHNMVFSGCSITYGTALAIVTATGMDTEMGKIAGLLDNEENLQTPLQKKLAQLGKYLGILALGACGIIFAIGLINKIPPMEIFMTAVSLAVSAIPEGLPAIVTIVLSLGVQQMVSKNAIIRRLAAVETLGSASVICSDKTGTLTQNQMTLVEVWISGADTVELISSSNSEEAVRLLRLAALCCDGFVSFEEEKEQHIGDPTETAIVLAAHQNGWTREALKETCPRLAEIPFDSDRKRMTTIHNIEGKIIAVVKGAFDVMAPLCCEGDLKGAEKINEEMSRQALRVLAIACKELPRIPEKLTPKDLEKELTFLGLAGMIDPPRPEAKTAVEICKKAGIRPVMITGDHVVTASAIASRLGILMPSDSAITGAELDSMSDSQLDERIRRISVYARVSPENKIRIVKAWQRQGQVVAMTGDGVNDAPALKAADIGCAMGITGTDAAKSAADMTLTDDNFATIVDAIREGRGIYANIKKVVGFLLGTNIGEVVAVFLAMLLWHKSPFLSIQLLWINLVTDSLPAIALGMEAVEADIMEKSPKPKEESLFANGFGLRILLQGFLFGILALIAFKCGETVTSQIAGGQTMAFLVLSLSQILQSYNMRSEYSLFRIGIWGNKALNRAALLSIILVLVVMFPPLSSAFGLIRLPAFLYLICLGLILVPLLFMETSKALGRRSPKE